MSDRLHVPADDSPAAWTSQNLPAVVGVMLRVVRRPDLAFDLSTELLAVAALRWDWYAAAESRMAWVLGFAPALIARAFETDCVPCDERTRNRAQLEPRRLTDDGGDR